jgi:hypothetical protein
MRDLECNMAASERNQTFNLAIVSDRLWSGAVTALIVPRMAA